MIRKVVLAACLAVLTTGLPMAASAVGERGAQAIEIKSDQLFTDTLAKTATFTGKVVARQADITIHTDKLVVVYGEKGRDVEKVEAFGNVRIFQGNRLAEAGHAVYETSAGRIILDQEPKVSQGQNLVTGKVITYSVNDGRSVVTGGPGERVGATIHPASKGNNGDARP